MVYKKHLATNKFGALASPCREKERHTNKVQNDIKACGTIIAICFACNNTHARQLKYRPNPFVHSPLSRLPHFLQTAHLTATNNIGI